MFQLSSIFKDASEEYIVIPAIRRFASKTPEFNIQSTYAKNDLLGVIEKYANKDEEAESQVQNWLDYIVKEGIKEIQLEYRELENKMEICFCNEKNLHERLDSCLAPDMIRHICGNNYSGQEYQFIKYDYSRNANGRVITMYFCKKMLFVEKKNGATFFRPIDYPIVVEYYLDCSWLCTRWKARSGLFFYCEEGFTTETPTVSIQKDVQEVVSKVEEILGLQKLISMDNSDKIKRKLFSLLDRYTHTPQEISEAMSCEQASMVSMAQDVMKLCGVSEEVLDPIQEDVNNLVEKYLSIYWPNVEVFTKDREAYPIHLSAIDEESSRVDQQAGLNQPLQSRAVFFDNKRMVYQQKTCQSIQFIWKRQPNTYSQESFPVKIYENKGKCILKFSKFTAEEDINHVLFSIINA